MSKGEHMLENNGYYELPDKGAGKRWLEIPTSTTPISIGEEVVLCPVDYELPDRGGSFRYLGVPINLKDLFPIEKLEGPEFPLDLLKLDDNND
jgi:hypothetical protein